MSQQPNTLPQSPNLVEYPQHAQSMEISQQQPTGPRGSSV